MKALVLTCDKYRPFTENMIRSYRQVVSECNLEFVVPYQTSTALSSDLSDYNLTFIRTPQDIKQTALKLLEDIEDDEFVFWALDDKYLTYEKNKIISKFINHFESVKHTEIDGVSLCRCRTLWWDKHVSRDVATSIIGEKAFQRKTYTEIWLHQIIRARILRHLFSSMPSVIPNAKTMDSYLEEIPLPKNTNLWVSANSKTTYGESTTRGKITKNCYLHLSKNKCAIPTAFEVARASIHMGHRTALLERILYSEKLYNAKMWLIINIYKRLTTGLNNA